MQTPFEQVLEFHETYGLAIADRPVEAIPLELHALRRNLIREEYDELKEAMVSGHFSTIERHPIQNDMVEIADALADLTYVVYGTAISYGIPLDDVMAEVQRSNMSKLGLDGRPIIRSDGKILKGPNFFKPNIRKVLYG